MGSERARDEGAAEKARTPRARPCVFGKGVVHGYPPVNGMEDSDAMAKEIGRGHPAESDKEVVKHRSEDQGAIVAQNLWKHFSRPPPPPREGGQEREF